MQRGGCRNAVALVAVVATLLGSMAAAGAATTTSPNTSSSTSSGSTSSTSAASTSTTAALPSLPGTTPPLAWILADADTGRVLDGSGIHTPERPASIVKVMTSLAALERLPPTATVTVSQNAVNHGISNQNPSGMKVGQTWSVASVISLMMIISANDAAYALAESTSGSVAQFANDETATAHSLGLVDSTFNDPAGLDDQTAYQGGPKMSPFDVATAVRDALQIPTIAVPASTAEYQYTDPGGVTHNVKNHNQMLPGLPFADPDVMGFKTGSTQQAGETLAATAKRDGRTLIVVIMDCADRYNWAKALFERGFDTPVGSPGTGAVLPAVQNLTYTHRAAIKAAAVKFLTGTRGLGSGTAPPNVTATSYKPVSTTVAHRRVAAAPAAQRSSSKSGGGVSALEIFLIVVLVLLVTVVLLRRRAVHRQRVRREARRRTQAALRRGSLPVVDGRYRAGMRTGRPPQSNVRVHRDREP